MSFQSVSFTCACVLIVTSLGCEGCGERPAQTPATPSGAVDREVTASGLDEPGLVIGEFALPRHAVKDGDTIAVQGADASLRLLGIDTEEIFTNPEDRAAARRDFEKYLERARGDSRRPTKTGTPMGMLAKQWAEGFFRGVRTVRLQRNNPKELRGRFGRYLAYVFAKKDGHWLNYNVECVRAGMSPYFTKYGYSKRFHRDFVQAEKEARAAGAGIWDPDTKHYRDYDERKAWWTARAEFIAAFDRKAEGRDDHIRLTEFDAVSRIKARLGKPVTILATVGQDKRLGPSLTLVNLNRREREDFPVIFFDNDVLRVSRIRGHEGEFVTVTGTVALFERGSRRTYQLEVRRPSQVKLSELPF